MTDSLKRVGRRTSIDTLAMLITLVALTAPGLAQENVRKLDGPGQHGKYLTPGQLDTWTFDGDKGETIIAHVATSEFDSILGLAVKGEKGEKGEKEDTLFEEIDDEGSDSRFAVRLPEKGEYRIRVHAYKNRGGGNYVLQVQRFHAAPLEVGKPVIAAFDPRGKGYHYFQGAKDRVLIPQLNGTASDAWKMLDSKGREMGDWAGTVLVEEKGEHYLVFSGQAGNRYDLLLREARPRNIGEKPDLTGQLQQGEMDVWSFQGKPGDFRLLDVQKKGQLESRLIYAPQEKKKDQRLARADDRPELRLLPVAGRGGRLRFAAILGRDGRYQLQLLARTPGSYRLKIDDPTVSLDERREVEGSLPVAGSAFYSFKAIAGQLFRASLASQKFVPLLRLYDSRGNPVESSAEGADGLESRITHMVMKPGLYRLQVSSLGDGGGGDFRLLLREEKLKEVAVGGRVQGMAQPNGTDFWAFAGTEGKTVIITVRSSVCEPVVSLYSPDGVRLAGDDKRGAGTDSLLAVKLPKTGRYTLWISSRRGAGDYTLRLIDGD